MYHPMDKALTIIGSPINKPIISVCKPILKSLTQPAFTCSKLTIETLQQGMKYVQS